MSVLQTATNIHRSLLVQHSLNPGERVGADYKLSQINRDTLPGNETAVGADLSRPPPPCISHKRGIAETWRNAFQVPIYRPMRTQLCILAILIIVIISPASHPRISRMRQLGGHPM